MLLKRFFAFTIDGIFLGISTMFVSFLFRDLLLQLGENLWYIGFTICGIYFILLDSKIGKGQTIGKRITKLKIVDQSGNNVTIRQSVIRYLIFSVIIFSSGMGLSLYSVLNSQIAITISSVIQMFFVFSVIGLMIVNKDKNGLHDYLSGSYVIKEAEVKKEKYSLHKIYTEQKLRIVLLIFLFVITLSGLVLIPRMLQNKLSAKGASYNDMLELKKILDNRELLSNSNIQTQWSKKIGTNNQTVTTNNLIISTNVKYSAFKDESQSSKLIDDIQKEVTTSYPSIINYDNLIVVLRSGYNLGIFNFYLNKNKVIQLKNNSDNSKSVYGVKDDNGLIKKLANNPVFGEVKYNLKYYNFDLDKNNLIRVDDIFETTDKIFGKDYFISISNKSHIIVRDSQGEEYANINFKDFGKIKNVSYLEYGSGNDSYWFIVASFDSDTKESFLNVFSQNGDSVYSELLRSGDILSIGELDNGEKVVVVGEENELGIMETLSFIYLLNK